jgi:hypothetical protein
MDKVVIKRISWMKEIGRVPPYMRDGLVSVIEAGDRGWNDA